MTDLFRLLLFLLYNVARLFLIQAIVFECKPTDPCGCSLNNVDINSRIVSGETVAYHSWSWAVSIRNSYDVHLCGGTILSKNFILTAAHCFENLSEIYLPYSIAAGVDSLSSTTGQIRNVSQIYIHSKWNLTSKENDIAILKLTTSLSMNDINIAKICLPKVNKLEQIRYPLIHSSLVAIGWGATTWEDYISPMHLRQVTLEAIDHTELKCDHIIKNIHLQFCATVKGGRKDTCQGQSGGPIMQFSPEKHRWILTGIISYGYPCGLRDYTGVYTRISVYIEWIQSIIDNDGIVTVEQNRTTPTKASNIFIVLTFLSLIYF